MQQASTFRPEIQGLRAIAVALVLLGHAGLVLVPGGFVGVDVFFVISGFLITRHLTGSLQATGRIGFGAFYAARARRILPAAVVTIIATAVASFLLVSPLRIGEILHDGIASALFVPNIYLWFKQTDYLAGTEPSPFQHFWSLGVEEQFYLVWPVLLLLVFLFLRRRFVPAIAGIGILSFTASVLTPDSSMAFFSAHTRAWEFAVGALVAVAAPRVPAVLATVLGWFGLAAILAAAMLLSSTTPYPGWAALLPVAGAALVLAFGAPGGVGLVLNRQPFQFLGAISYSLYLVHWPVLVLVHERIGLGQPLPVPIGLALVALCVPLAWCLYRVVETPFRTRRSAPARPHRRVLVSAAGVSVLLVGSLVAGGAVAAQLPLSEQRAAAAAAPSLFPAGTDFVPSNLAPSLDGATADTGDIYSDGCQQGLGSADVLTCAYGEVDSTRTIALFGDSHAGRWFPALDVAAAGLGYRLDTFTKSRCRSEDTVTAWTAAGKDLCSAWREAVIAKLVANPPDVLVLANHLGPIPEKDPTIMEEDWEEGLDRVLDRLPTSSQVIMLADTPEFASSPVLCLSSRLDEANDCAVQRSGAFNTSIRNAQYAAAAANGATVVDLTDYFCNETDCPAIIGSTLVYSDEHHVTATFSKQLGEVLRGKLAGVLR